MKRCPQCNRVEADDALAFCRADGTPLVIDSASIQDAVTRKPGSDARAPEEAPTSRFANANTNESNVRATQPTTVLQERPATDGIQSLSRPKGRRAIIVATTAIMIMAIAVYAYYETRKNRALISSIAVMPFVNGSGDAEIEYLSDGMRRTNGTVNC